MRDHQCLNHPVIVPLPAEVDTISADAGEHRYLRVPGERSGSWTLLTGHGHVLVEVARDPRARIRDIGPVVGLTERTVQAIVADLEAAGYLTRTRTGRRIRYRVNPDSPFRHKAQRGLRVGPLLDLLTAMADADTPGTRAARHRPLRSSRGP
jgi:hypothetical protein